MLIRIIAAAALVCGLSACVSSTVDYRPPTGIGQIQNSVTIDEPFEVVWDKLIQKLSQDFFVINNVEKASRIINVSFSSQRPSEFVDCGTTSRSFKNARGEQNYFYKGADSANYTFVDANNVAFNTVRRTKLEGRSNIYVAPASERSTTVSVNTKYVLTVDLSFVNLMGQPGGNQRLDVDFTTKEPNTRLGDLNCQTTGTLENRIIAYAR